MNETERIIEVTGYSKNVSISWHEDPTRHLLKERAVNARSNSDADAHPSQPVKSSNNQLGNPARSD